MPKHLDRLALLLNNYYKTLYEQRERKFNRVLRRAISFTETLDIVDDGVFMGRTPTVARYYADLTINGSDALPGEVSAWGVDGAGYVRYGAGVLDETEMFIVMRVRPTWASGASPSDPATLFEWRDDDNNRLILFHDDASQEWRFQRLAAGVGAAAAVGSVHIADDDITLAAYVTAAEIGISLDGGSFVTAANSSIPTPAAATFDIGSRNGANDSDCAFHWVFVGLGPITDPAAWDALGNTDPTWDTAPEWDGSASFLWPGIDEEHEPSRYGEASYG
jgi:hypothetical protein